METVLITGGAGFIGSHFIKFLLKLSNTYKIINVDKLTYAANLKTLAEIKNHSHYDFFQVDICDSKKLEPIVEKADYIINFAAESHVDRSIKDATEFITSNIQGVHTLLELAKKHKIKRFLQISTDEVYGSISNGSFKEEDPLNPSSPYAASKASADLLIHSYIYTYDFPAIITRTTNNYGPFQFYEKLVPFFTTQALQNKQLPVYGNGLNIRDWIYVLDNCEAIFAVFLEGKLGHIYNIGAQSEKNNLEITQKIIEILHKPSSLIKFVKDRPGHDTRYSLDTTKIQKEIGWAPSYSFEESFTKTIEWYKENAHWWKK